MNSPLSELRRSAVASDRDPGLATLSSPARPKIHAHQERAARISSGPSRLARNHRLQRIRQMTLSGLPPDDLRNFA